MSESSDSQRAISETGLHKESQVHPVLRTTEDIARYLKSRKFEQMQDAEFEPGKPLIVVLPDVVRDDDGRYRHLPRERRPLFARFECPTEHILFGDDTMSPQIQNSGGQIDYFIIEGGRPVVLRSSFSFDRYDISKNCFFHTNDSLAPRADPPVEGPKRPDNGL